jgi:negative regulator of flagellin synthesis FlgM
MNIQSSFDPTQALREQAVARPAANPPGTETPSGSPQAIADGDTATISSAALSAAAASGISDVRTDKVAAIQQALASGTYAVSPSDVAGKLIDHLLQR